MASFPSAFYYLILCFVLIFLARSLPIFYFASTWNHCLKRRLSLKQLRLNCIQLDTVSPGDTPMPSPVSGTPVPSPVGTPTQSTSPVHDRRFSSRKPPTPPPTAVAVPSQPPSLLPTSVSEFNFGRPQSTVLPAMDTIPSAPSSPLPIHKSSSMSNIDYESAIYALLSQQDPFYDRTPWFSVIGRCVMPLCVTSTQL